MVRRNADGSLTVGEVVEEVKIIPEAVVADEPTPAEEAPEEETPTEEEEKPEPKAKSTSTTKRKTGGRPKRK